MNMGVKVMNILPIEKQFEIMDLIYQKLPDREIATRANKPKSTVQNYKKRGLPIYRKYAKNHPGNTYPTTVQKELTVARQQFQEIQLLNDKLIMERNTANRNANDLQKSNAWKDTEIDRLNFEKKEKETELNSIYAKFDKLVSTTKDVTVINTKLKDENKRKDDTIKNIQETLQQYKIDLAKADEGKTFYDYKIRELTKQRDEFKDKAERLERQHEFDLIRDLLIALLSFLAGMVVDRKVLPKIKEFILSWGAEHGINTEGYANLF